MRTSDIVGWLTMGMLAGITIAGALTLMIEGTKPVGVGLTMIFVVVPLMGLTCYLGLREDRAAQDETTLDQT